MDSLFFSDEYLNAVVPGQKWGLSEVKENGKVVGELYYRVVEKFGFRRIESIPLIPAINAPIQYSPKGKKESTCRKKNRKILSELFEQLPKCDDLDLKLGTHIDDWRPLYWKGYQQTTRYTSVFRPEILHYLEDNYKQNLSKRLRKAKSSIEVSVSDDISEVYDLICKTYNRKNDSLSFSRNVFEAACQVFKKHSGLRVWSAFLDKKKIGAVVFFEENQTSYCMFSGLDTDFKSYGSQALLIHSAIKDTLSRGMSVDMEGSMIKQIDEFNMSFNPEIVPYYKIAKTDNPVLKIYKLLKK